MSELNFTRDNLSAAFDHAVKVATATGEAVTVYSTGDSPEVLVSLGTVSAGTLTLPEGASVIATATPRGSLV